MAERACAWAVTVAMTLAGAVAVAPPASAAPAAEPSEGDDEGDDESDDAPSPFSPQPFAEAQRLYDEGRVKFDTADYPAAIELWTEAYGKVPDAPDAARIKALLIYNIATARERVFEVGKDLQQLRQAKILLNGFESSIPTLYPDEDVEAELARVRERVAKIDAKITEVEEAQAARNRGTNEPGPTGPTGGDTPTNAGRGLVIGGAVSLGLGGALLGMMGAGLGVGAGANDISALPADDIQGRRDQFARGRVGNTLAIVGGALGGALVVTGAVLLAIGVKQKRNRNVALAGGPGLVGVGVRGRF